MRFRNWNRRKICIAIVTAVLVIAAAGTTLAAALDPYDCRILEGVTLGGLDVGGMTKGEARAALQTAAENTLLSAQLPVTLPQKTIFLSPDELNLKLKTGAAVRAAYAVGRSEDARNTSIGLGPYLRFEEDTLREIFQAYGAEFDTVLTQPRYALSGTMPELSVEHYDPEAPCQTLLLTLGTPEVHLDTDALFRQVVAVYDQAIAAGKNGSYQLSFDIVPDALPDTLDLQGIYEELFLPPVDDCLNMETYEPIPGSYGYRFDPDAAQRALEKASYGQTLSIPMEYVEPEILGEEVYFRDVLGSCETRHTDNENRNTNLRLVCQFLDGLILQPGEEFSYNAAVGERSTERGFKSAGSYSIRGVENTIGGGVCQGSTTLYNCALLADLEILERYCHGYTVGYVPIGLDAAVNWLTNTDLKFRNSTHFPIQIQAELSDGYMKMKLLGTDEKDYYVEMKSTRGEDELRIYSRSYKCKISKETGEEISREVEAYSTYMYFPG